MTLILLSAVGAVGCAPRVSHKELSEDQVGLVALKADNVRKVALGSEIQSYVSTYPIFAEVLNTEVLKDTGGFVDRYNVYAREKLTFAETGLAEVDPFLLRAARVTATVRVGTRLLNYIGLRLKSLDAPSKASKESQEVYYAMTPEELSLAVQRVRDSKGMLNREQRRELGKDIVALAANIEVVAEAAAQARGLVTEGENLKSMLSSTSYAAELQSKDAAKAKLLPEVISNLNGTLGALKSASSDGEAIARNARVWKIYLADAMQ
jgi:hypothetical protein